MEKANENLKKVEETNRYAQKTDFLEREATPSDKGTTAVISTSIKKGKSSKQKEQISNDDFRYFYSGRKLL